MGAVVVAHLVEGLGARVRLDRLPRRVLGVREEAEDRRQVRPRRAREVEAVLLRAGVCALVWPDPPGPVVLYTHAREEPVARVRVPVRADVGLGQRPDRVLALVHEDALLEPVLVDRLRVEVGIAAVVGDGQVDLDDVERALLNELRPHLVVDDVVGRSGYRVERADRGRLVANGVQGTDLGHAAPDPSGPAGRRSSRSARRTTWRRWRRGWCPPPERRPTTPIPISRKRGFRMFARWPGLCIHDRTIDFGVASW